MSTPLYDLSVPVFVRGLTNLAALLAKAEAHAASEGKPAQAYLDARLYPDMAALPSQVQRASDAARFLVARLGQLDNPPMEDKEASFAELQDRIAATIAYLETVPRDAIDGREEADIEIKTPRATMAFKGLSYLLDFALPNFFFHVTIAYALLRHQGVPVGKMDFLGPITRTPADG